MSEESEVGFMEDTQASCFWSMNMVLAGGMVVVVLMEEGSWGLPARWKSERGKCLKYLSTSDKPPGATNHILCSYLLCTRSIPSLVCKTLDLRIIPSLLYHLPLLHQFIPPNKQICRNSFHWKNLVNNLNHTVTPSLLKWFLSKLPMTSTGPNPWFSFTWLISHTLTVHLP